MAQAERLYEILSRTGNRAAGQALLLGLQRAESHYQPALVETALKRRDAELSAQLVAAYESLSGACRQVLAGGVDRTGLGIRQAARAADATARGNALTLMEQARPAHLADVLVDMLRDPEGNLAERAAKLLVSLARETARPSRLEARPEAGAAVSVVPPDVTALTGALRRGLLTFRTHRRSECVYAAMLAAPATDAAVWAGLLTPHHPVTQTVLNLMNTGAAELAGFVVSALAQPALRGRTAKQLAAADQPAYVLAVVHEAIRQADEDIDMGLRLVRQPRWLRHPELAPQRLGREDRRALGEFLLRVGASAETLRDYLLALLNEAEADWGPAVLKRLRDLPEPQQADAWADAALGKQPSLALAALRMLIETRPPGWQRRLIRCLGSAHAEVRDLAGEHCHDFAFATYWRRFDRLSRDLRLRAGRAVFKIDAHARQDWMGHFQDHRPEDRIRAIRIGRVLGQVDAARAALLRLAADDNRMVRSYAVAALGELSDKHDGESARVLLAALDDQDPRVKANAIEALERRGLQAPERVAPLTMSDNNRVRANAIKAQLAWRVKSAQAAIERMVSDARPAHRRSARWLVAELHGTGQTSGPGGGKRLVRPLDPANLEEVHAAS